MIFLIDIEVVEPHLLNFGRNGSLRFIYRLNSDTRGSILHSQWQSYGIILLDSF